MKQFVKRVLRAPALYKAIMKIKPFTGRYFFLLLCIAGLIWYAIYTRVIIGKLENEAIAVTQTYAELIRAAISENMSYEQMNVIFEEIIQKSSNPIIITDTAWVPIMWKNVEWGPFYNKSTIPFESADPEAKKFVEKKISVFLDEYEPKSLYISETQTKIGYLVFGNSSLVSSLALMPVLEFGIIGAFLLFAYLAFHNIRVTERSNLWVGLAKETAHQLGTPISALMGWVEYLRSTKDEEADLEPEVVVEQIQKICDDMDKDLKRLHKVTSRFSQIGSNPDLIPCDVNEALRDVMEYFRVRLPLLKKKIAITPVLGELPLVPANRDLLEWVLENLLKNSIDAIDKAQGEIEIKTEYNEQDRIVRILHTDNGRGIARDDFKKVFAPGFTTKKRGWGLGLTLTKRVIEDYHNGRIFVSWSQREKGTTFCVELPVDPPNLNKRT